MTTTLVTGATRGLGLETARRLVELGHTVYVGARDIERGRSVAATLGARSVRLDVTDDDSVVGTAQIIHEETGALDVLVNNAGIAGDQRPPGEETIEDLVRVFETNVFGAARVLMRFTRLLEASRSPTVVNVSSAVGSLTLNAAPAAPWSMVAYPMSKAALNMLTIQYARAYPRWRVNSVTPGLTNTDFIPADVGLSVEQGAEVIVRAADSGPDATTGRFIDINRTLPW